MRRKEMDYGVLSDVSRDLNCVVGDCRGITISRRTTKGFKRAFNLDDSQLSDENAEHIIHAAMVGTVACFSSKEAKKNGSIAGVLMLASLIFFYQKGK